MAPASFPEQRVQSTPFSIPVRRQSDLLPCTGWDTGWTFGLWARGWDYAEVTADGVPLDEIDYRTMASRRVPELDLCGELRTDARHPPPKAAS